MRKCIVALMLCFVSIVSFAGFSNSTCIGFHFVDGEFQPKSVKFDKFNEVKGTLMSNSESIVLSLSGSQLYYTVTKKRDDAQSGITTFDATDSMSGEKVKIYLYLNEEATKAFKEAGADYKIFEIDINRYMNRETMCVLFVNQ